MASFAPLFPLEKQFQAKDGRNNTGGWLKVYLAATDDTADTYSDYLGTRNPERIVLDDNGRATVICDKAKAYRLEVYDISGALLWTEEPVYCSGTGGGGVSVTRVISTDGSIGVESSTEGSVTTYDLSMAPPDSDEFLEWIKCSEEDCGASWKPVFQDGTMETEPGQGIKVHGGHLYHFTCSFTVDPDGTGVNYDTFHVNMYCGSTLVESRSFDIDSSLTDEVLCEFSHDLVPEEDACVYFSLTIPSTCEVQGEVQAHRVYSGINAVPDTCATKQWVEDTFTYNMSGRIPYSALEYDASSQITAIDGSAINGGTDTTAVSSIASTYAQSAVSGFSAWTGDMSSISSKADQSSLENCCTTMSGYVSALSGSVSSLSSDVSELSADVSAITGLTGEYVEKSAISAQSAIWNEASGVSSKADASSLTGKLDNSASSNFYPMTGNPSGFLTSHQELSGYVEKSSISAQSSQWNEVSAKLDQSAASEFYPMTGNPSGFLTEHQSLSAYVEKSAISAQSANWNEVSAKLDESAFTAYTATAQQFTGLDHDSTLTGDGTSGQPLGVNGRELVFDSSMTTSVSGNSAIVGVNSAIMSGYLPESASGSFQPSGNYVSADEMSAYVGKSSISAESAKWNEVSAKVDDSALSTGDYSGIVYVNGVSGTYLAAQFAWSADAAYKDSSGRNISELPDSAAVSGIASSYVESGVSSKLDISAFSSVSGTFLTAHQSLSSVIPWSALEDDGTSITAISGSAIGNTSVGKVYSGVAPIVVDNVADTISISGRELVFQAPLSTSESAGSSIVSINLGAYQTTAGMTAYQLSGDYAYNSSLTAYQPSGDYAYNSALTAYQPSGDYAYNSAVSSKADSSALSSYALSADVSGVIDTVSSNSASWAGGGGDVYVSSFAYNDTAISSIEGSSLYDYSAHARITTVVGRVNNKLDASASSLFYPVDNPSGFISGVDLTPYQEKSAMTAYQPSGDYIYASSLGILEI